MLSDTISLAFVSGLITKLCGDVYSKSVGEWGKNRVACIFDPWGGSDVSGELLHLVGFISLSSHRDSGVWINRSERYVCLCCCLTVGNAWNRRRRLVRRIRLYIVFGTVVVLFSLKG